MKIDQLKVSNNTPISEGKSRAPKSSSGSAATEESSAVDYASLSSQLQEIESTLAKTPVVDAARVEEIKNAIAEGRFQINPERIADRLIDSVREMIDTSSGKK